jgi:hypothetical protein
MTAAARIDLRPCGSSRMPAVPASYAASARAIPSRRMPVRSPVASVGEVDAAPCEVLVHVAEDVRPLHRPAEGARCPVGLIARRAEDRRHQPADGPGDAVTVEVDVRLGLHERTGEVLAHAGHEVRDRVAGERRVAADEVIEDARLGGRPDAGRRAVGPGSVRLRAVGPRRPRLHGREARLGARVASSLEVHEVVQCAQDEVEQLGVLADPPREQARGEREGPRDAPDGPPRLRQEGRHLGVARRGHRARGRPRRAHRRRLAASARMRSAVTWAVRSVPGRPAPGWVPPPT